MIKFELIINLLFVSNSLTAKSLKLMNRMKEVTFILDTFRFVIFHLKIQSSCGPYITHQRLTYRMLGYREKCCWIDLTGCLKGKIVRDITDLLCVGMVSSSSVPADPSKSNECMYIRMSFSHTYISSVGS